MSRYIAGGIYAIAGGANKTVAILGATAVCHPRLTYLQIGTDGAPGSDQALIISLQRSTTLGTSTPVTPSKADPGDAPAIAVFGSNCSAEPSYSGPAMPPIATNPRTTFQWGAYDRDARIAVVAGAANGLGAQLTQIGGAIGNVLVSMSWDE